jgi:hypothetical protein
LPCQRCGGTIGVSKCATGRATLATVAAGGRKEERTADHAAGAAEQPSACGVVGHSCPSSNADRPTESAHSVDRTGSDRVVSAVRPNGVLRVLHCCAALPVGNIAGRPAFGHSGVHCAGQDQSAPAQRADIPGNERAAEGTAYPAAQHAAALLPQHVRRILPNNPDDRRVLYSRTNADRHLTRLAAS